ncbi:MAG TPA: hypothetical protein VLQ93_05670, partial [Myxococcaceae bacterium]|nr:hypothetical protein [Myxococcaceae bacterium]
DGALAAAIRLSSSVLEADGSATATVMVANPGLEARNLFVELVLQDASGARVRTLGPEELLSPLGAGAQSTFTRTVGAAGLLAGDYEVVARIQEAGTLVASTRASLELLPGLDAALALSASRARYAPGEPIELSARVENRSTNAFLSGATVSLEVLGPEGLIVHTRSFELPLLSLGASVVQGASLAPVLPAGTYQARAWLQLGGTRLATSETSFVVEGRPLLQGAIAVEAVAGEPPVIAAGGILPLRLALTNSGTAPAESVVVRLRVVDPVKLAVVSTEEFAVGTLVPGASWSDTRWLSTVGLKVQLHGVSLAVEWAGAAEAVLSTARFQVADGLAPLIASSNLTDGMFVQGSVWTELRVLDDHSGVAAVRTAVDGVTELPLGRLEGTPMDGRWAARIPLESDGPHVLTFSAVDLALNDGRVSPREGNPISLTVVSDTVRPSIIISGVSDGAFYGTAVSPEVKVTDEHLASATLVLDGRPFLSGTPVESDGRYVLRVEAQDKAANRSTAAVTFVVDRTAPSIAVSGVSDGEIRAGPFEPGVSVTDDNPATQRILLDGVSWQPGTLISKEGSHVLEIEAEDRAGNRATQRLSFVIDTTPPLITIEGVTDGGSYDDTVTPVVIISDPHLRSASVMLDGVPFKSGTPVESDGLHHLVAEAEDAAGNRERVAMSFLVQRIKYAVDKRMSSGFIRALALVRAGTCELPVDEVERLSTWLTAELRRAGGFLQVATDEQQFQAALRSGLFDTFLMVGSGPPGAGCENAGKDSSVELDAIRKSNIRAVTERVFSGRAGLLVIRPRPADWPHFREALGLDTSGQSKAGRVVGWSGPFGSVEELELSGRAVRLKLLGATPVARYGAPLGGEVAVATHVLGEGRTVSFGFEPSQATPSPAASEAFQQALTWVRPQPGPLAPLGIAEVEISVENMARPVDIWVRELLAPGLTAVFAEPTGSLEPSGRTLEWSFPLGSGERAL